MKKLMLVVVLLCSLVAAVAQEVPEAERPSRDDIVKFFDTLKLRDQMNNVYNSVGQQVDAMVSQQVRQSGRQMTAEDRQKMQELVKWTLQRTREMYPMDEMLTDMIPVYQKYMSKADLDATMAFYNSPAGQRMLQRMPLMTTEAMKTIMPKMQQRMMSMTTEMEAKMKELYPAGTSPKAQPAAKTTPSTTKTPTKK